MKHLLHVTSLFTFLVCSHNICFTQGNNNGNLEPVQSCLSNLSLCINQMTPSPVITVNSDLQNLEYLLIDQSVLASNNSGPAILAVDDDGIFAPSAYGIIPGGTIDIIPIAYNLIDLQNIIDDMLKGLIGGLIPCCTFIGTACSDLNNAGIFCGSDITSFEDIFPLFNASDNLLSIIDFETAVSDANAQLQNPTTPPECGGGDFITYAYGNACSFSIYEDFAVINTPDHVQNESIFRSDYIESGALVSNPLNIEYFAGNHVDLVAPFEVQLGAELLADILSSCQ